MFSYVQTETKGGTGELQLSVQHQHAEIIENDVATSRCHEAGLSNWHHA